MLRGRCVFASGPVPRRLYSTLHISSQRQANRVLPSLVPVSALFSSSGAACMAGKSSFLALQQVTEVSNTIGGSDISVIAGITEDVRIMLSTLSSSGPFTALSLRWLCSAAQLKCICSWQKGL